MVFDLEQALDPLSKAVSVPADQLILVLNFIIAVPLSLIQFYLIRGAYARHFYSIFCGLSLGLIQFGLRGLTLFAASSLFVYFLLLVLPRKKLAFPIMSFLLILLSSLHIYRIVTDYMGWKMDASSVQMLMTCKLSLLAYSYQDYEVLKTDAKRVPNEQKRLVIEKLPNLIEYYSYLFFYPSFVIGPSFEYAEYIQFVNLQNEFSRIPDTLFPCLRVLGIAFLFTGLTAVGDIYFPQPFCYTDEYASRDFLFKVVYFNLAMVVAKMRYTSAWKFTESAMIGSGFGYTENSKSNYKWERAVSINWKKTEYAWTTKEMVENWNISVSVWLRRCIYNRILVAGKDPSAPSSSRRSIAQHCAYLFSAFWHGFYPAYYIMFFFSSINAEVSKMVYISDWSFLPAREFFKWLSWFLMWQVGNFNGILFLALDLWLSLKFMAAIHYYPIILLAIGWLFFKITGLHRKKKEKAT